ncbi:hypothetical protein, partial [Bifidobacterium pullorum]|uniref:hypothetical protein n=1 Tax=Bifidobacterium pullorum TaxID=78448 RepID=UPI003994EE0A
PLILFAHATSACSSRVSAYRSSPASKGEAGRFDLPPLPTLLTSPPFSPLSTPSSPLSPRLLFAQPTTKIQIQQINNQSTDRQTNKHKNKDNNKSTITNTKAISKRAATP